MASKIQTLNFLSFMLLFAACVNCTSDSYLSAYKLTHDLNTHFNNQPTDEKVVFVDANTEQHVDVHPVYVQGTHDNHLDGAQLSADHHFHAVDSDHSHHADHIDVEHHYQPEYHEHYIDVKEPSVSSSSSGLSGLGQYGSSVTSYSPPAAGIPPPEIGYPTYGPPVPMNIPKKLSPVYGPPHPVYGPPSPVYGPPSHHVGPSPPHFKLPPLVAHEYYESGPLSIIPDFLHNIVTPHAFLGILDKIKWFKIDLFTIGKLILKFFIFKKILTFLTILFLLLVIPSLKHKGKESVGMMTSMVDKFGQEDDDDDEDDDEDDEDESRERGRKAKMFINKATESINALTSHVLESIERFEQKLNKNETTFAATDLDQLSNSTNKKIDCGVNGVNNTSVYCKSQSVIEKIKTIMPFRDDFETKKSTIITRFTTTTQKPILDKRNNVVVNKSVVNLRNKSQSESSNLGLSEKKLKT